MFESFYGLTENPFRMSADGQFRFMHKAYKKGWAYLNYALDKGEGFVLIAGRPGTGKTTLIQDTLSELDGKRIKPVKLISNQLQGEELLRLVALELGLQAQEFDKATLLTRIEQYALMLHQEQRRLVVIVDEAQNLSAHGLEELRLLSNLQTGNQPLFQIVLIGQEELRSLIYGQAMENITQRIVASCTLEPMPTEHVQGYVEHRLGIVGWQGDPEFDASIFEPLQRVTHGVPRDINLVMARLLLYGALEEKRRLTRADLITVLKELSTEQRLAVDQIALVDQISEAVEPETIERVAEDEAVVPEKVAETAESEEDLQGEEIPEQEAAEGERSEDTTEESDTQAPDEETRSEAQENIPLLDHGQSQSEDNQREDETPDRMGEPAVFDAQSTESGFAADSVEVGVDTEPLENDAVTISGSHTPDRQIESDSELQSDIERLPPMQALPTEEQDRPRGLLTDVDELLGEKETSDGAPARLWRWFFYPLAIGLLVFALLAVRYPDSMDSLWADVRERIGLLIKDSGLGGLSESQPQSTQHRIKAEGDEPVAVVEQTDALQGDRSDSLVLTPGAGPAKEAKSPGSETQPKSVSSSSSSDASEENQLTSDPQGIRLVFDSDSNKLTEDGKTHFNRLLQRLRAEPSLFVVLTGVSSNQAGTLRGIREALMRAELVSQLLMREGIAHDRISIEGKVSGEPGQSHIVEANLK